MWEGHGRGLGKEGPVPINSSSQALRLTGQERLTDRHHHQNGRCYGGGPGTYHTSAKQLNVPVLRNLCTALQIQKRSTATIRVTRCFSSCAEQSHKDSVHIPSSCRRTTQRQDCENPVSSKTIHSARRPNQHQCSKTIHPAMKTNQHAARQSTQL